MKEVFHVEQSARGIGKTFKWNEMMKSEQPYFKILKVSDFIVVKINRATKLQRAIAKMFKIEIAKRYVYYMTITHDRPWYVRANNIIRTSGTEQDFLVFKATSTRITVKSVLPVLEKYSKENFEGCLLDVIYSTYPESKTI
jgi:restriction endonuclease